MTVFRHGVQHFPDVVWHVGTFVEVCLQGCLRGLIRFITGEQEVKDFFRPKMFDCQQGTASDNESFIRLDKRSVANETLNAAHAPKCLCNCHIRYLFRTMLLENSRAFTPPFGDFRA